MRNSDLICISVICILFSSFPSAVMCAEMNIDANREHESSFRACFKSLYLYFEVGSDGYPILWRPIPLCFFEKIRENDDVLCGASWPNGSGLIEKECFGTKIHPNNKMFLQKSIKGKDLIALISKNKEKKFFDYFYVEDFRIHPILKVTFEKNGEVLLHTKFNNIIRLRDNSNCAFGKAENGFDVIDRLKEINAIVKE